MGEVYRARDTKLGREVAVKVIATPSPAIPIGSSASRVRRTGSPLAITREAMDHYSPRWAADSGSLIYFTPAARPGEMGTIWESPALGGAGRRLVNAVNAGDLSHDGNQLTYVWTLPLDGGESRQLPFGESSYEFPDLAAHGDLVVSRTRARSDVAKIPVTGSPQDNARRAQAITKQTGRIQTVTISPDESEVAFLSDNGGHANVWTA